MNIYQYHSDPESLKGYEERWTKIPQFAEIAFEYSIKSGRRFPEGEAGIANSEKFAYRYARDVIKGRFPEGEAAIANSEWKQRYEREFKVKL